MLPADVKVASLETLYLRRRLAPVDLPQGDDGRRARRLGGDHGLARLAARPRGTSRTSRRSSSAAIRGRRERIYWISTARPAEPRPVIAKALAGIENALLDLKAKALGVPVYELFGGPTREAIPMYWSHCGTTRARAYEVDGDAEARVVRGRRRPRAGGRRQGYGAFKTNVVVPGEKPRVLMPGFAEGGRHAPHRRDRLMRSCGCSGRLRKVRAARPVRSSTSTSISSRKAVSASRRRSRSSTCSGSRSTCSTRARSHTSVTSPRCRSAPARTSTQTGGSGRTSRPGGMDVASVDVSGTVPPGEEDRRPRRDVRSQLRAAQLLHPSGDLHRRETVCGDPERANPRGTTSTTCPGEMS